MFKLQIPQEKINIVILSVVTFLVFSFVLQSDFIRWDDGSHITENHLIASLSPKNIYAIFTNTVNMTYIPLTILSFAIEYQLFGLNPFYYHLNNILLHIIVTGLVYGLGLRLGLTIRAAFLAGLLFGIHPIHVESIAWATQRKDVLYSIFYILSLYGWLDYIRYRKQISYVFSFVMCVFSMLSKPMAVSLPLALLLLDWFEGRKDIKRCLIEKAPFFIFCISLAELTHQGRTPYGIDPHAGKAMLMFIWSMMFYINSFILPVNLVPFQTNLSPIHLANQTYLFGLGSFFIFILVVFKFRRHQWFIFSVMLYLVMIFFLLRFGKLMEIDVVANRYMYLPCIGFCFLFGRWADQFLAKAGQPGIFSIFMMKKVLFGMLFVSLSVATIFYSMIYKNNFTFWSYAQAGAPQLWLPYYNIAQTLDQLNRFPAAIELYTKVLKIAPAENTTCVLNNRGVAYQKFGKYREADQDFTQAIEKDLGFAKAYHNRGVTNRLAGKYQEALSDFNQAILIDPNFQEAINEKANLLAQLGKHEEAISSYTLAIQRQPLNFDLYLNRGVMLAEHKKPEEALNDFSKVIQLMPKHAVAYFNRGSVYALLGKFDEAMKDYDQAARLNPQFADIYINRAQVFEIQNRMESALKDYSVAIQLTQGRDIDLILKRAMLKEKLEMDHEALMDYSKVITLNPFHDQALAARAQVFTFIGDYNSAIKDLNQAITINPRAADYYLTRSIAFYQAQRFTEADQDLKMGKSLGLNITKEFEDVITQAIQGKQSTLKIK